MRIVYDFEKVVRDLVYIPPNADTTDTKAIIKIATAYLKLLFPNVCNADDIDKEDFKNYCLEPAMKMR